MNKESYNISCKHIKYLDNKYNNENDLLYKRYMLCKGDYDDNHRYDKYINYLDNLYVSKKSCIFTSTEPDEFKWASQFVPINANIDTAFNENTRRKIIKY
jgi:hypothetical protein